jgi:Bardet-Biedl syndrome 7 protein
MDKEITNIYVADSNKKVNTFCASGHSIRGINKKGKEFFKFDTNHTEDIKSLFVEGSNLWSSGDYILNSYKGSKTGIEDNFYYLSDDKIYDMRVAGVSGNLIHNSILACDDSSVRVLVDSEIYYSQNFNSPVLALNNASDLSTSTTPHIAYGLKNGCFGMIDMQRDSPLILWDVNETHASEAPVNIIF